MKKRELETHRKENADKLEGRVNELRLELKKTYVDVSMGKEKNLAKIRNLKRDIAQFMTIIREQQMMKSAAKESKSR